MAHWQDIGGALNIVTRDIYSEGLQVPKLKLRRAGQINEDVEAFIRMNVRIPERAMGDLNAQTAAVNTGAKRFLGLIERYGRDAVLGAITSIMDGSEVKARRQVLSIPDGEYFAQSFMDDDAVDLGRRVPIRVRVTVCGDQMTVEVVVFPATTVKRPLVQRSRSEVRPMASALRAEDRKIKPHKMMW